MKHIFLLSAGIACFILTNAQSNFDAFIDSAYAILDSSERVAYVEQWVSHLEPAAIPLIEEETAHFIYYGNETTTQVEVAGDFNGWGGEGTWLCEQISFTPFFYYSHIFEPDARLDYKFILNNGSWILDPLNPNTVTGGYGPNSELAMPEYIQPWEITEYPDAAKGTLENFTLQSTEINKIFSIQVYLPPGYHENTLFYYPAVYVHDGHEYISLGSMDHVIDNLLDSNLIDPVIGVFIRPNNRETEYMGDDRFGYAQFVAETVVPYIDDNYRTMPWKEYRLTMGTSLGGNISGLIAYRYPEVFANSGWHSPALWVNDQEVAKFYLEEAKEVRIYFNVGTYEDLGVDWEVFTAGLTDLGYIFAWDVLHEGHSWGQWRATTDDILQFFFPAGSVPLYIKESEYRKFLAGSNFPNPFSESTIIPLSIGQQGSFAVEIFDCSGSLVASDLYSFHSGGDYEIVVRRDGLLAGVYFLIISNKDYRIVRKILVE